MTSSIRSLARRFPYGVYDLTANTGWVSVGVDHDTAEFAVETVRRWWRQMGRHAYPAARRLLLTADGGGSNSSRSRLWKFELQKLADALGLRISVCHFPPGTSKWNKIEHRMFCHITKNWRGRPLVSHEVVVNVIGATTTQGGLAIQSELDEASYPTGRGVTDEGDGQAVHQARYVSWRVELQPVAQIRIVDTVLWREALVAKAIGGNRVTRKAVRGRTGIDPGLELSFPDFSMWMFRDIQARRLVEELK